MNKNGETIKLDMPGPHGGSLFLVLDYEIKTVSLVEVQPSQSDDFKITVLEVQPYNQKGF